MTTIIDHIESHADQYFGHKIDLTAEIDRVIKATIIAAEPKLAAAALVNRTLSLPRKCHAFLGFDLLLTKSGELKLMEVNANPATACDTEIDLEIKSRLYSDYCRLTRPKKYFVKNKLVIQRLAEPDELPKEKDQRKFSLKAKEAKDIL